MASQSRSSSVKRRRSLAAAATAPNHATALSNLSPFSTLACQVEATNAWRKDLKSLYSRASERFADVCWSVGEENESGATTDEEGTAPSWLGSSSTRDSVIWAHKAILYARAPNTFQARFLHLRTPAANLGAMASSSTVSLPVLRAPSPSISMKSRNSSVWSSLKRPALRGATPPSSYSMTRAGSNKSAAYVAASDSEAEEGADANKLKRNSSNSSLSSSIISRPMIQGERRQRRQPSYDVGINTSSPSLATESDNLSVMSSTSTVKAPMNLDGVNQVFFEATLEYLYTAEESMKEAFEFLYEDRVAADEGTEERLEKLRQDLVFMWRSRLYSDIEIVIGEEDDERTKVRTIPDINASATSLALQEAQEEEEEETASFSAHRMILVSRSPYFASQLLSPYSDANTQVIRLPSPPFTPASLHFTLGFMYTGTLFFSNRTFDLSTAFQLWRAASYLQIDTLSTLVSSLITHDFCHEFACSPPCKTCVKRIPRTLGFVSSADVHDAHLQALARNTVSGDDFGSYWSKEVGNLDYTVRGALVSDVCSKIDSRPGYAVHALRQLSIIGTRIDAERSSRWVDAVRWMCESVQSHVCMVMELKLAEVVASEQWTNLVEGVGFLNDVLEKALSIIVDGLTEKRAAKVYEVLVGQVLLREEGLPCTDIFNLVVNARKVVVRYVQKRWVNVRASAGFNAIESWALKELADEIDVPASELLLPEVGKEAGSNTLGRRTTGQRERTSSGTLTPSTKPNRTTPAGPGQVLDGEREAGPIHLRAAVLNRNAARASVANGFRSTSQASSSSPSDRSVGQEGSVMDRPRRSMGATVSPSVAQSSSTDGVQGERSTVSPRPSARSTTARSATVPPPRTSAAGQARGSGRPNDASPRTPTASRRSVSREDSGQTPTRSSSASVAAFRTSAQERTAGGRVPSSTSVAGSEGQAREVGKRASEASLRESSSSTAKALQQSSSASQASRGVRSRQTSATSTSSLRKASSSSATAVGAAHNGVRKVSSSRSMQKRREEEPVPPLPAQAPILMSALQKEEAMQLDRLTETQATPSIGTQLSLGIPCVVAPRNKAGRVTRFRAVVKYIGPLMSAEGNPVVGVEVALPLPGGVDEGAYDFHDGRLKGVKYFDIGSSQPLTDANAELSHKPEREARRVRLAQMMQGRHTATAGSLADAPAATAAAATGPLGPSAKRRKDLTGAGLNLTPSASRGLFILPSEVLWVVI